MDRQRLSPSTSPRVDAACDRFEELWRRGEVPEVAQHLDSVPQDERAELASELALLDAQWRRRRGLAPAEALPRFERLEKLGAGSFGVTWRARDARLGREVALKVAHALRGEEAERFAREARAASRLAHEGIARVHETVEVDGAPAIVTELVAGSSLADRLASGWRPDARASALLVTQVADALQHAHEQGVVHRDVKPHNVVVETRTGRPVLVDFGLARDAAADSLTMDGHVLGTPAYMSPEQARGDGRAADARTDVHACGALLYELLTARPPFPPGPGLLERVVHDEPVAPRRLDPTIPRDLETITLRALAKSPAARYPSARALAEDLERFLRREPIRARPVSLAGRAWRWARREPVVAGGALAIVALLAVLALLSTRAARTIARERDVAIEALERARAAESQRDLEAFESRMSEAEARAASPAAGRRFAALEAIDEARKLLPRLGVREDRVPRMRSVLASALCRTDLQPRPRWLLPPGSEAVAFSEDGRFLARSDALGTLSVRDAGDVEVASLASGEGPAMHLAFSPDARFLLSEHGPAKRGSVLLAWDVASGRRMAELRPAPPSEVWARDSSGVLVGLPGGGAGFLALPSGALRELGLVGAPIAVASDGRIVLRDASDGRRLTVVRAARPPVGGPFAHLGGVEMERDVWSAALPERLADRVLVSQGTGLAWVDLASGRSLSMTSGHDSFVTTVVLSEDGRHAASHAWDGVTRTWNLATGHELASCLNAVRGSPHHAFTPSGSLLGHADGRAAGPFEAALDVPVRTFDLARALGGVPGRATLSPDGRWLATWAEPGRIGREVAVLAVSDGRVVTRLREESRADVAFVGDGSALVTSGDSGILARPIASDGSVGEARIVLPQPCEDMAVSADGRRVAAVLARSGELVVADLADGRVVTRFLPARRAFTVALAPAGDVVALGTWHAKRGACHAVDDGRLLFEPASGSSFSVAFSEVDGSLVVDGGDELRLLDPRTGDVRAGLPLGGGFDVPALPAVSRDGRILAVPDRRRQGAVRLLDAETLRDLLVLEVPDSRTENVLWCALDAAGRTLAAGTVTGQLATWDLTRLRADLRERDLDW